VQIAALEQAITAHRSRELPAADKRQRSRNPAAAVCACGRRIRVAPTVLALGPVLCGVCGERFREREACGSDRAPGGAP
jgi:hypothetical protein